MYQDENYVSHKTNDYLFLNRLKVLTLDQGTASNTNLDVSVRFIHYR